MVYSSAKRKKNIDEKVFDQYDRYTTVTVPDKSVSFVFNREALIFSYFFVFLHSLEAPRQGASNGYSQPIF